MFMSMCRVLAFTDAMLASCCPKHACRKIWPNTLHASRLIHKAGEVGGWELQHKAKGLIFDKIYESGSNVSELEALLAVAAELGIPDAEAYLTSGDVFTRRFISCDREQCSGTCL